MTQPNATRTSSVIPPKTSANRPHLAAQVAVRFVAMTALIATLLFLPAGTLRWWQGWAVLAGFVGTALAAFLTFLKIDPQVVERRLRTKERLREQKQIIRYGAFLALGLATLPGFDHRLGWSERWWGPEPVGLEAFSLAMVLTGMLGVAWVIWINRYAGRTIRVEEGQTLITSGPYRFVRHPLYAFSLLMWMFVLPALGSYVALPALVLFAPFYVLRILNEEKVLRVELPGYTEYCEKTRWRIVPGVW
jgi:protein-S-isoprenylcysteine O-methyltransferase Ste14